MKYISILFATIVTTVLAMYSTVGYADGSQGSIWAADQAKFKPPSRLRITWFGAASILLDDGEHSILIDPFVSRKNNSILDIVFGRKAEIDHRLVRERAMKAEYARAKGIFISHSHYDHILDAPAFAKILNIPVYGTPSVKKIVDKYPVRNSNVIEEGHPRLVEDFRVYAIRSDHGNPPFLWDPLDDEVQDKFRLPASIRAYGRGEVFIYYIEHPLGSILHVGSAAVRMGSLDHLKGKVDVVLLSLVGRGKTDDYVDEIVNSIKPKYVIPIHYDFLFSPLNKPLKITRTAKFSKFLNTMKADYRNIKLETIGFDEPWELVKY